MVLEVVILLVTKLNFLQVNFNANIRDEHVLHGDLFGQFEGTLVSHVSEGVQKLLGPEFEKRHVLEEVFALLVHELFDRPAFTNFEEV